jgi:superfamily II DNA or RNA helicase
VTADYLSNNRASRKSFSASSPRDDHAEDHTIAAPIAPDDLAAGVSPIALRDYQRLAVDYIHVGLGEDPIYVALPTGTGKAVAAAAVASNVLSRGRVLVIAHRKELIGQLAGHMRQWCGSGQVGVVMAERDECGKPVIVGSIQTLSEKSRLDRVLEASEEPFALVIIDKSYGALVDRLSPGVPVLGFSATPRTRATSKFYPLFKACVFERTIGQMSEAGWLAPLRQQRVVIPLDLTGAPTGQNAESGELRVGMALCSRAGAGSFRCAGSRYNRAYRRTHNARLLCRCCARDRIGGSLRRGGGACRSDLGCHAGARPCGDACGVASRRNQSRHQFFSPYRGI